MQIHTAKIGRLGLLIAYAILLTLAFAPAKQFYLALVALIPFLIVIAQARTLRAALGWGWLAGILFFSLNVWPFARVAPAGAAAMTIVLGTLNGLFAAIVWGTSSTARPLVIASIWVALEFLQARIYGFPWLLVGHSQSPFLLICQIADAGGVYLLSFLIVGINACLANIIMTKKFDPIGVATWSGLLILSLGYGAWRMSENSGSPGPMIMVVESDVWFARGGAARLTQDEHLNLLFQTAAHGLQKQTEHIDLMVWPESVAPPINSEALSELQNEPSGHLVRGVSKSLAKLASQFEINLAVGGYYVGDWKNINGKREGTDIRNAVYLFDSSGVQRRRYDKIHLVPFGEYTPLVQSLPWLGSVLEFFGPRHMQYVLHPGAALPARFEINSGEKTFRFITPVCFEDMFAEQISSMFRPIDSPGKQVDFIANLSNDGWFGATFISQRLQAGIFRCIENRLPMARSSNGGISGFVDSVGRTSNLLPAWKNDVSVKRLTLDSRRTFYQMAGDWFAILCTIATAALIAHAAWKKFSHR